MQHIYIYIHVHNEIIYTSEFLLCGNLRVIYGRLLFNWNLLICFPVALVVGLILRDPWIDLATPFGPCRTAPRKLICIEEASL